MVAQVLAFIDNRATVDERKLVAEHAKKIVGDLLENESPI
jgi:hypothetical protein